MQHQPCPVGRGQDAVQAEVKGPRGSCRAGVLDSQLDDRVVAAPHRERLVRQPACRAEEAVHVSAERPHRQHAAPDVAGVRRAGPERHGAWRHRTRLGCFAVGGVLHRAQLEGVGRAVGQPRHRMARLVRSVLRAVRDVHPVAVAPVPRLLAVLVFRHARTRRRRVPRQHDLRVAGHRHEVRRRGHPGRPRGRLVRAAFVRAADDPELEVVLRPHRQAGHRVALLVRLARRAVRDRRPRRRPGAAGLPVAELVVRDPGIGARRVPGERHLLVAARRRQPRRGHRALHARELRASTVVRSPAGVRAGAEIGLHPGARHVVQPEKFGEKPAELRRCRRRSGRIAELAAHQPGERPAVGSIAGTNR